MHITATRYLYQFFMFFFILWKHGYFINVCTTVCPPQSSNITVNAHSFNVTVTWISFGTGDSYVVRHRQQNSGLDFVSSPTVSSTTYEIEGLESSTEYEVQVCIVNDTSNCGNCTKCFSTDMEDEPPGAPQNLMLSSSGPQAITVSWTAPTTTSGVTNYIVSYGTLSEGLARNFTIPQVLATINNNILPSTTYVVAVSARNQFGFGPLSDNETLTTESFSTVPGALLVGFEDGIAYYPIAEESDVGQDLATSQRFTITNTISKPIDIDYDYRQSHIYITTNDSSIVRYSVSVSIDEINARLTINHTSTETLYSGLGDARSITVDWINDRVYWVEYVGGASSQIYSGSIDGGSVKAHGLPLNGLLDSLTVDPVHGYFYWVIRDVHLVQVNLSVVETAVPNTDLSTYGRVIFSGNQISSFTLDLADSQYYYVATDDKKIIQNGLGGNQLGISIAFALVPTLKTSFGKRAVFAFKNFLPVREASTDTFSQGDNDLMATISDARMFRSSYQPLPVPPGPATNIKVLAMSNSVLITWDSPEYEADVFGPDAFRDWEYLLEYRPLDSSDAAFNSTKSTNITLPSLTPGTTYIFNVTVQGITSEQTIITPNQYVFTTFGTNNTFSLLVSSDKGVLLSDTMGKNIHYLSSIQGVGSTDAVGNSLLKPTRYYFSTDAGLFFTQDGLPDITDDESSFASQALDTRTDPTHLQLDWLTQRLYWVEQSLRIVRVPTVDFTASGQENLIEIFEIESEGSIMDTAIDPVNGVFFWTVGTKIKSKNLNGLQSPCTCYTLSDNPRAIAIDTINQRLFVLYFDGNIVNVAVLNYTPFGCNESSFTSRAVQELSLNSDNALSMVYAANTLYFSQYRSLDIKSISAEFASVGSEYILALGCIRVEPNIAVPQQLRALSVLPVIDNTPLPDDSSRVQQSVS